MLKWLKKYGWIPAAALALSTLVLGTQSLRIPTSPVAYKECLQTAHETKQDKSVCKLDETVWDRTLNDPVAYYTLWLTLFTGALAVVGIAQWGILGQQIALGRAEFNSTHRPRLIVRSVMPMLEGVSRNPVGQRCIMNFELANVGDTPARVVATAMSIRYLSDGSLTMQGLPPVGKFAAPGHDQISLAPGEARSLWYGNPEATFSAEMFGRYWAGLGLFFVGHILYVSDAGVIRRTSFCRRHGGERGYWPPAEHYDYDQVD